MPRYQCHACKTERCVETGNVDDCKGCLAHDEATAQDEPEAK